LRSTRRPEAAEVWYAERSKVAAARFKAEIEAAMEAIQAHPDRYAFFDETHQFYICDRFPYYVAYRRKKLVIEVVAIRHTSQDDGEWQAC
jgi:plasmid stabilization system protein ParE